VAKVEAWKRLLPSVHHTSQWYIFQNIELFNNALRIGRWLNSPSTDMVARDDTEGRSRRALLRGYWGYCMHWDHEQILGEASAQ
jgi:hypothetical protein